MHFSLSFDNHIFDTFLKSETLQIAAAASHLIETRACLGTFGAATPNQDYKQSGHMELSVS